MTIRLADALAAIMACGLVTSTAFAQDAMKMDAIER